MSKFFLLIALLTLLNTSYAQENRKTMKVGPVDFPVLSEQEIDNLTFPQLKIHLGGYLKLYIQGYVIEWMRRTSQTVNPIPEQVFGGIVEELSATLNETDARNLTKMMYRPGGLDEVNKKLFAVVDKHVQEFEKNTYGRALPRGENAAKSEPEEPKLSDTSAAPTTKPAPVPSVVSQVNEQAELSLLDQAMKYAKNPFVIIGVLLTLIIVVKKNGT